MPTIANRSPYRVSVKTRPDLAKRFPFSKQAEARAYRETLRSEHPKAVLTQGENKLLVRIRNRGHADATFKATSYAEAEQAIFGGFGFQCGRADRSRPKTSFYGVSWRCISSVASSLAASTW